MSLHTFTAAGLTTARDRGRHPAASRGQIVRTLLLTLALAAAVLLHRQGHAVESVARGLAAGPERAGSIDGAPGWPVTAR